MPEIKRPLKVFLCHASQDKSAVRELYSALNAEGWIDPWLDKAKILPGQDWRTVIEKAVEESDVVIVCLSNQSVSKEGFVQREIKYAYDIALEKPEETIFLIPLRLDDAVVPRGLRSFHWVDYFGAEQSASYSNLLDALKLRYEQKLKIEEELAQLKMERQESEAAEKVENEIAERIAQEKAAHDKEEHEAAEKTAHEQAKREAVEKARLEAEDDAKRKAAKERAEREAAKKIAREKADKKAVEKVRLEAEEQARQKVVRGKADRDVDEKPKPVEEKPARKKSKVVSKELETQSSHHKSGNQTAFWVAGFAIVIFVIGILSLNAKNTPQTFGATATPVVFNPHSDSSDYIDSFGVPMRPVPAGEFTMGSPLEQPIHTVYLDAFYMDKYEVTNALYKACVDSGICDVPITNKGRYNDSKYANHPVVNVDWDQATAYCEWRGGGLPTEAQWEKAARGTDERSYPWGEGLDCNKANYYDSTKNALCVGDTTEVGSYESGKSPYGIYDLAGNVSEFVADWYSDYQTSPSSNPQGPDSGKYNNKVRRGGSLIDADVGAATRSSGSSYYHETGFRCAKDTNP